MQPPRQHSWINLVEIKGQMIKKLGLEKSKQYFDYLNRFLSLKLSKAEFDKLCLRTVGKDNIRLHNQLIRAILKNVCTRKDYPSRTGANKKPSDGVYHQNGSVPVVTRVTTPLALTNGDILPPSPRKERTREHDRRITDRRSALGSNGKTNHASLGFPFGPVSISGARRASTSANSCKFVGLLETTTLKERMQQITEQHGLQRVSIDCASVLNSGLDAYLKGLIRSCAELNGSRFVHEPTKSGPIKHPVHTRSLNGLRPDHHHEPIPVAEPKRLVTLLDFRVAMELNCKQLGEDWPILLEKICTHAFEE